MLFVKGRGEKGWLFFPHVRVRSLEDAVLAFVPNLDRSKSYAFLNSVLDGIFLNSFVDASTYVMWWKFRKQMSTISLKLT